VPGLADARRERQWLRAIAEAARTAARSESKIRRLLRLLDRIREPVIVFTEYRDTLARLHRRIAVGGHAVTLLHGGLSPAERSQVPQLLQEERMVLLATDAASEGLNLHHHCRIVVHYELPWHPMRLEQRTGRVDRIGQSKRVHEIALVAATTAERLVIAPLTLRASRRTLPGLAPHAATALTESRVAEAVMGGPGVMNEREPARPAADRDTCVVDLKGRANAEAVRIQHHRALIARSECGDVRLLADRPYATTLVRNARSPLQLVGGELAIVFLITLEDSEGRRVHAEINAFRLGGLSQRIRTCTRDDLRALTSLLVQPDTQALVQPLQHSVRNAIDRVEPLWRRMQDQIQERRRLMTAGRLSAARALAQAKLFARRTPTVAPAAPTPNSRPPDLSLTPHVTLLAAVMVSNR
jgi:hypothetical protein